MHIELILHTVEYMKIVHDQQINSTFCENSGLNAVLYWRLQQCVMKQTR